MQDLPHRYSVAARGEAEGAVDLEGEGLPPLRSAGPAEFGGPGDLWSPETLLVAAVADCYILTFRAVARASKLSWVSLECRVEGTLDKVDRTMRFTQLVVRPTLRVPAGTDEERAQRVLARAEQSCLVTNSLTAESSLSATVEFVS
jgi:peroxiredoxin-like protein